MTPATYATAGGTAEFLFHPPAAPTTQLSGGANPVEAFAPEHLSPSALTTFAYDCQVKYFYRKVLELREPNSPSRVLGSAVHAALAENFRDKLETGEDLPIDGVVAIYRDALAAGLEDCELQAGESADEIRETGEALTRVYMDQAAPSIHPAAVEMPVSGMIGGVRILGYVDVIDQDGRIIDIKTAAKKPSKLSASHRAQLTTYAMLAAGVSGECRIDTITKTKTVTLHQQSLTIGESDRNATARLYSITRDAIAAGIYIPNRSSFLCSRKHCGYWNRCEAEYGGRVE